MQLSTKLPEPLKVVLRPFYHSYKSIYYTVAKEVGRNYFEYDLAGQTHRFYYTPQTAKIFDGLVEDGLIVRENVPAEIFDLDEPIDCIIDLGAHFGIYSLILGKLNPETELLPFEPDDFNRSVLNDVVALNNIDCRIDDRVVSNHTGIETFYTDRDHGSESHSVLASNDFIPIEKDCVSLPDIFHAINVDSAFVKMDVEGAEEAILYDVFPTSLDQLEGVVEIHPDKIEGTRTEILSHLDTHCSEVSFISDTSPTHPNSESIHDEYNRPMYYFKG